MLILMTLIWGVSGFALARYILHQSQWLTLIPSSLALGMTLQTLLLNILLHPLDAVTGYWLSVVILLGTGFAAYLWQKNQVEKLHLGASPRGFIAVSLTVLFLWGWILPALSRFEYIDQKWQQPLAAVIANGGLPVQLPTNPDYCTYYHYAPDLLAGVMFRVSGSSMATVFDWMNACAVLAVLGLAFNVAWRLSSRRALAVGVLGMSLFFLYGSASWLQFPFYNETVRDVTSDSPVFDYFLYRTDAQVARPEFFNFGFPFTRASFVQPYNRNLHSHTVNIGWMCALLVILVVLDVAERKANGKGHSPTRTTATYPYVEGKGYKLLNRLVAGRKMRAGDGRGDLSQAQTRIGMPLAPAPTFLLVGVLLGVMPLASETLWPVPLAALGLFGVYLLMTEKTQRSVLMQQAVLIFAPALLLGFLQGGTLTDQLFCHAGGLGVTDDREQIATVRFFEDVGYYSRMPTDQYVSLTRPENWLRWVEEWGVILFLTPFLFRHYLRRREPFHLCLLAAATLPIVGLLGVNFEALAFDSARIAAAPMYLLALMAADWLDSMINKPLPSPPHRNGEGIQAWGIAMMYPRSQPEGGLRTAKSTVSNETLAASPLEPAPTRNPIKIAIAGILVSGMVFNGVFMLIGQATYDPARSDQTDLIHAQPSWLKPIDAAVQEQYFGTLGSREALILDMGFHEWHNYTRPALVFGHYTRYHASRARLDAPMPALPALWIYPDPQKLHALGIAYLYLDEIWWANASAEARQILENPAYFEEVFTLRQDDEMRRLYRVIISKNQ